MNDKFRKTADRRLDSLKVDDDLKIKILKKWEREKTFDGGGRENDFSHDINIEERGKKYGHTRLVIPLAICFCLLFSVAVVAAVPQLREKFFRLISPQYEEFAPQVTAANDEVEKIKNTAEDQGLQVEVTNAVTDGKTMVMYVTIHDPMGRMDDTVDIYDYFLNGFTFMNSQLIEYDASTNTAKFCLLASGGEAPEGGKVQYRISSLMTGGRTYDDFDTGIQLQSLLNGEADSQFVRCSGGSGDREMMELLRKGEGAYVLETDQISVSLRDDIDFVSISNIGSLEGYLHIQTKWEDSIDNHGDLYLLDGQGKRVPYISLSFDRDGRVKENDSFRSEYTEYIYDLDGVNLEACSLFAFFVREGKLVEGSWEMEFDVSSVEEQSLETGGKALARTAVITPIGVYLYDTQLEAGDLDNIQVTGKDGDFHKVVARFTDRDGGKKNLLLVLETPLTMDNLKYVAINGITLYNYGP